MKKQVLIIGAIALATMVSQAAITSVDLTLGSRTSSSDTLTSLGTISVESGRPSSTGGVYQTMSYKVTGLTLDVVGTADDEITFELGLLGTGSNTVNGIAGDKNAYFAVASDNGGDDTLLENDEGLTISYDSATVTLGAGAIETASIAFDGFTGFSAWNWVSGETFEISGTVASDATAQTVSKNGGAYGLLATEDTFTIDGETGEMRYSRFLTGVTVTTTPLVTDVPPTIGNFTISSTNVLPGATATLSWNVLLADSLIIDQGVGDVTGTNAVDVTVNADTLYTLIAMNAFGSSTATVSVVVDENIGFLAHYPFDVDGTAVVGPDATLGVAASITNDAAYGSGSLALSGTPDPDTLGNDGAVSGDSFSLGTGARTVAFWMKAAAGDKGDDNATMISLGSGTSNGSRYDVRLNGDNLRLEIYGYGFNTTSVVADGTWHHIAVVAPADATVSDVEYYIDGAYVTNMVGSRTINTGAGPLRVGDSYIQTERNFKGLLDDVRLYSRVLSASEVAALVTEGPGLPAENLQISVPGSGEIVVLSWTGEYGKPYGVETNSNLTDGDWQLFSTVIGDGVMSSATNAIGPTQTFYRVIPE